MGPGKICNQSNYVLSSVCLLKAEKGSSGTREEKKILPKYLFYVRPEINLGNKHPFFLTSYIKPISVCTSDGKVFK